jgi:hypothetical protein
MASQLTMIADPSSGRNVLAYDAEGKPLIFPASYKSAVINLNATGTVINAVSGKRIKVFALKLIVSAALSVNFRDGGATLIEGAQPLLANAGYIENVNPPAFLFGTTAGNSLDLVISGAGTVTGRVSYWDDDSI